VTPRGETATAQGETATRVLEVSDICLEQPTINTIDLSCTFVTIANFMPKVIYVHGKKNMIVCGDNVYFVDVDLTKEEGEFYPGIRVPPTQCSNLHSDLH
jgi:hypothetical protein